MHPMLALGFEMAGNSGPIQITGNIADAVAALAVGIAALGAGIAERGIGAAALGALAEDSGSFGVALVMTVLPETLAIITLVVVFVVGA